MILGIDFDGVICKRTGFPRGLEFMGCEPTKGAVEAVWWLRKQGHNIYVLTGRTSEDWSDVKKWLKKWRFPKLEVTNVKKAGTAIYVDDRAIRFENNWYSICKLLG